MLISNPFFCLLQCAFLAKAFYMEEAATSCPSTLTACSTNPTDANGLEIVPASTVTCGDTVAGDTSTVTGDLENGGLGFCGTSTGNNGLWYK